MTMNVNFYIPISKVRCTLHRSRVFWCAMKICHSLFYQVDENMRLAQQRDAVNQAKFYFRREIFTPTSSRATSGVATPDIPRSDPCYVPPSTDGITNGFHNNHSNGRPKQRMMENCFPPLPLPDEGLVGGSVKEEYGEYTMDEIINGRVSNFHLTNPNMQKNPFSLLPPSPIYMLNHSWGAGRRVSGTHRPSRDLYRNARPERLRDA